MGTLSGTLKMSTLMEQISTRPASVQLTITSSITSQRTEPHSTIWTKAASHTTLRMVTVQDMVGDAVAMAEARWLDDFPELVWYIPQGVANILLFFIVQKYYRI